MPWYDVSYKVDGIKYDTTSIKANNKEAAKKRIRGYYGGKKVTDFKITLQKLIKNPSNWLKLDHPHALAIVDDDIKLISSKKLTNPQKKKFRSFVAKIKKALK